MVHEKINFSANMFSKKSISAFSFVLIVLWTSTKASFTQEQIKEAGKLCKAVQEDLDVVLKYEVPSTETGKCLVTCILKLVKTINADGPYDVNIALESLKKNWPEIPVEKLEEHADKCRNEMTGLESLAKTNNCEYGHKVAVCLNKYFKNDPSSQIALKEVVQ